MNCTVDLSDRLPLSVQEWPDDRSDYQKKRWPNLPKEVEAALADEGYRMLEPFRSATDAFNCVCPEGHKIQVKWYSFKCGSRCKPCAEKKLMPKRLKQGQRKRTEMTPIVEKAMLSYYAKMLDPYRTRSAPIRVICMSGHVNTTTWRTFRGGSRCPDCDPRIVDPDMVDQEFRSKGCTPLSRYVNAGTPIRYICPEGHNAQCRWYHFKNGVRCAECAGKVIHNADVRDAFMAAGYKILADYVSSTKLIPFLCDRGHEHAITWGNFSQGIRCGQCFPAGYNASKPGTIYYVRFDLGAEQLWKIGITNKTVKRRFRGEKVPHEILWSGHYSNGQIPLDIEHGILEKHKEYRYKGRALLSGNTECFTIDVLGYDKPIAQLSLLV